MSPARLVRRRFSDAEIERLERLAWWDWPPEAVAEHARTIMAGSVDDLEAAARTIGRPPGP